MMINPKKKTERGQVLLEALIALGVATIVIAAITMAVVSSLSSAESAKSLNLATHYAQEGLELSRKQSQEDWATFSSMMPDITHQNIYCLGDEKKLRSTGASKTCEKNVGGVFNRVIIVSQNNYSCPNAIQIESIVGWSDGKCTSSTDPFCHKITLTSCLANIQ